MKHNSKKKEKAARLFAAGYSVPGVAKICNVGYSTAYNWSKNKTLKAKKAAKAVGETTKPETNKPEVIMLNGKKYVSFNTFKDLISALHKTVCSHDA